MYKKLILKACGLLKANNKLTYASVDDIELKNAIF